MEEIKSEIGLGGS
jgi:MFS family permease